MKLPKVSPQDVASSFLERFTWEKVKAPRMWRPTKVGEQIVGFFGGKSVRNGHYGQYEVVMVPDMRPPS